MRRLVLVDGNALLHRAYHATPPFTTSFGELVNAVYGFSSMVLKVISEFHPEYLAVAWDETGPTFRHQAYTQYKATRKAPDEGLSGQYKRVHEVVKAFNIPEFKLAGYEADDLIGTLVTQSSKLKAQNLEIVIVTGDRDIMQLIDENIKVFMPKKTLADVGLYGVEEFVARYGFYPKQLVDYKGLAGDHSDNIPGVAGIGDVTATRLIHQFGGVEEIYQPENLKKLPSRLQTLLSEGAESAVMSKKLATLDLNAPIKLDLEKCVAKDFDRAEVIKLFEELEFKSLISRITQNNSESQRVSKSESQTHRNSDLSGALSPSESFRNPTTDLDHQVEPILQKMSKTGVLVDLKFLSKFGKQLKDKLVKLEQDIYSKAGHEFNLNSPKQLQVVLFDELKLPAVRKTKTGISTDEGTLTELASVHPVIPQLLEYRKLFKLVSTYIDALPKYADSEGRIHSTFNVEGAATGRLSCVSLNSEILTKQGWKKHNELKIGELVLGYDITRNRYYWTKLKDVHTGKGYIGLLQITNGHTRSFRKGIWCTGEHKWIVKNNKVIGFSQVKNLPRKYATLLLPKSIFPNVSDSLLTVQEAFLLGWYLTDGFLTGKKSFGLGINVVKKRSIDLLEKKLDSLIQSKNKYKLPYDKSHYVTAFHISSKIFNRIYKIYDETSPSMLVLSLSKQVRESMLWAMLEGDGSMRRNKKHYDRFGVLKIQKKATCEIFELLCVSLGKPYTAREYKLPNSGKIFIGYNLLLNELISNKNSDWNEEKIEEVWCPETECGTWVMRQGNQIVVTGNSQDPNLQNIPIKGQTGGEIRKAFIAPKGKILLGADYSQIELRIMAHLADDPGLKEAFSKNLDIHAATASKIFNVAIDKVTKQQRMIGKTMNFATLYGQGPHALSRQLGISFEMARQYIAEYFEQFPKVRKWMEEILSQGYEKGYVETIWGRRRYIPELKADNRMIKSAGERAAVNHPIQGSSADMIKKAMMEIDKELVHSSQFAVHGKNKRSMNPELITNNCSCQMILQVHDELLFECSENSVYKVAKMVKDKMEHALELSVPVKVELKVGQNWGEMESLEV